MKCLTYLKVLGLLVFFSFAISCTKGPSTQAKLNIEFDQSLFGTNKNPSAKPLLQSATNSGAPQWGLSDPSSLGDIHCYAIFIHADEPGMNESVCHNENDVALPFGPRAGFFGSSQPGSIEVTAGPSRTIYLAGMSSADGTCHQNFAENSDLESSNFSTPFIIGQVTVDLNSGDNVIQLPIQNSFTNVNKIKTCNFFDEGQSFDLILPNSNRSIWIDDNTSIRTAAINHNGVSVECSRNGTTNYGPCDTDNSFTWNIADIGQTHYVKVQYSDGSVDERNFTPSTVYPGLTFESCNYELSSSTTFVDSTVTTAFAAAPGQTICLSNGVDILDSTSNGALLFSNPNVNLVVRQGEFASISSTESGTGVLQISQDNINVLGVTFNSAVTGAIGAISVSSVDGVLFKETNVNTTQSGYGIHMINSGGTTSIKIEHSYFNTLIGTSIQADASTAEIKHSTSDSTGTNILTVNNSTFNIQDSFLTNTGVSGTHYLFKNYNGGTTSIERTHFKDGSGAGISLDDGGAASVTITLNDNKFERLNSIGSGSQSFIKSLVSGGSVVINSATNGNFFCNTDTTTAEFTTMTDGNQSSGNWVDANQLGDTTYPYNTCN